MTGIEINEMLDVILNHFNKLKILTLNRLENGFDE